MQFESQGTNDSEPYRRNFKRQALEVRAGNKQSAAALYCLS